MATPRRDFSPFTFAKEEDDERLLLHALPSSTPTQSHNSPSVRRASIPHFTIRQLISGIVSKSGGFAEDLLRN